MKGKHLHVVFFIKFLVFVFKSSFTPFRSGANLCIVAELVDFVFGLCRMIQVPEMHVQETIMSLQRRSQSCIFRNVLREIQIIF